MNREIKFRAWDKEKKKMVFSDIQELLQGLLTNGSDNPLALLNYNQGWEIELMQYTGLKDKNGKEIYEGDIVKYQSVTRGIIITLVTWDESNSGFIPFSTGHYFQGRSYMQMFGDKIEIIGNIYENPELVKEAQR